MTLKNYLIVMLVMTFLCLGVFALVLRTIDPRTTNWLGFALFYAALFLSALGVSAIAGFLIRFALLRQQLVFYSVSEAFRQSFLFSLLFSASLFLLSKGLFTWINISLLAGGAIFLEFFLLSAGRSRLLKNNQKN